MKQTFQDYLTAVGITEPIMRRVETFQKFFEKIFKEEILDIYVSDYVDEDGTRQYQDLRLFSGTVLMIAFDFLTQNKFSAGKLCDIVGLNFEAINYDFGKATEKSRLLLSIKWADDTISDFKASKENCDFLMEIYEKYFAPIFAAPSS